MRMKPWLLLMLLIWPWIEEGISKTPAFSLAESNCSYQCGKVMIPYPFGIGNAECAKDKNFLLKCNNGQPFLLQNIPVLGISLAQGTVTVSLQSASERNKKHTLTDKIFYGGFNLEGSPFMLSNSNKFIVLGCNVTAFITEGKELRSGCITFCNEDGNPDELGSCSGIGCCKTSIPNHLKSLNVSLFNLTFSDTSSSGLHMFLAARGTFNFSETNLSEHLNRTINSQVDLDWVVGEKTCKEAQANCGKNTVCSDSTNGPGYRCFCKPGFSGNPYLPNGCEGIGLSLGFLLALSGLFRLYLLVHEQNSIKLKRKFFKRNGGLLLEQQISSDKGKLEKIKIFTSEELEKATDHYNDNRILGQGGQGIVYKAMLPDGSLVAVKKSEMMDEGQIEHFVNEVVILSQINHRHVVKLLGCCLETEVPLLVYEYVSNGTLSDHIHAQLEEAPMKWADRFRIAKEVAGAIAYMHSAAAVPIYHRDVKSSNILLDEKYRAKLSDFGISRSVPTGKTHLTTSVQGTFGYLDPEYFQSYQCTAKSDVYSFGVVLVELLTGRRPISMVRSEDDMGLAAHFISSAKENHLLDVLDPQVVLEGEKEELLIVANLALRCLKLNGRKRPTMKEVALKLENLKNRRKRLLADQQEHQDGDYSIIEPSRRLDVSAVPMKARRLERSDELELDIQELMIKSTFLTC
ncbi:wall-associated receptor kinase-like 8 isoform X2 [Vitis riparia]|uniref:wall-associated receptor kinase-like 8 isoform X2 n=1 Tax=Vitis riparia TaxID=96939 RepID=UPI00155B0CBD|nr:wall-associated receptor kinase-like 8 isoform X2 [Vitis riparia]